ncbi:TPA: thermonuclease family protein, partial [Neisseria gonorrhoeae]
GSDAPVRRRASAKSGHSYTGTVSKVYDGDTLHVIDGDGAKHKIRMAYIDAPEMKQAYGTRSRDNLRAAAEGRKVSVRVFETDRYQREVAQVSAGKTDLNLMQVQDGAAWHYKSYAKEQQDKADFADYADAQIQAERERKGLWKAKNPQAPWAYRRAGRSGGGNKDWMDSVGEWLGIW